MESVNNNIEFNQLVWAGYYEKNKVAYWPAVVINPKGWIVPLSVKPKKTDHLVLWLDEKTYHPMCKVSTDYVYDFVKCFNEKFSLTNNAKIYVEAIANAVKVIHLAINEANIEKDDRFDDIQAFMHEIGNRGCKILVTTREQWQIAVAEKFHRYLIDIDSYSDDANIEANRSVFSQADEELRQDGYDLVDDDRCVSKQTAEVSTQTDEVVPDEIETVDCVQDVEFVSENSDPIEAIRSVLIQAVEELRQAAADLDNEDDRCASKQTVEVSTQTDEVVVPDEIEMVECVQDVEFVSENSEENPVISTENDNETVDFSATEIHSEPDNSTLIPSVGATVEIKTSLPERDFSKPLVGDLTHLRKFPCLCCPTMTSDFDEMKKHMAMHNVNYGFGKIYRCSKCSFHVEVESAYFEHFLQHFDFF